MKRGKFHLVSPKSEKDATMEGVGAALREAFSVGMNDDAMEVARLAEMIERLKRIEIGGGDGVVEG